MKIVLVHHRYYIASGPERYLFNIKQLLEMNGHKVIPFSINYKENLPSEYQKYFIDPVIKGSGFHINKIEKISITDKFKIIKNVFFNSEAYSKFEKLTIEEKPDLIYLLQFYGKISTSILDVCKKYHIPAVLRLSDYNLICAKNILYRDGKICELCFKSSFYGVKNKCIQDSFSKSLFFYLARQYNYLKRFNSRIDAIIVPSEFTKSKLSLHKKYCNSNIVHIPSFIWKNEICTEISSKLDKLKFCYLGRIADDKGIEVMLNAFKLLKEENIEPELVLFGDTNNPYGEKIKNLIEEHDLKNVHLKGFLSKKELFNELKDFAFSISPSVWYDNMPNSFIESQALGIPVIASNIGSLRELTNNGYNGFLFESENSLDLANILKQVLKMSQLDIYQLRINSLNWVSSYCSEEIHYSRLMYIFKSVILKK